MKRDAILYGTSIQVFKQVMLCVILFMTLTDAHSQENAWIRVNQLGYSSDAVKVAVYAAKTKQPIIDFTLVDAKTNKAVLKAKAGNDFGVYGPFVSSYRLDFSKFKKSGTYYVKTGNVQSPAFKIGADAYEGSADFGLRYMRQQRSEYNPFLKDSCHTKDGYTIYGPMPDGTPIDVSGGWHDATDYLQYVATSANATYLLLAAYRDFPGVFGDAHLANGLEGKNNKPDVMDEAVWGLTWLLKMHPREDWMFNQLADDRDHAGFRLPNKDSVDYGWGKGNGRAVYFITGKVQGLGKYKNRATGAASTAGKFTTAFALGSQMFAKSDPAYAELLKKRSLSAYKYGLDKPGAAQTAPNKAPYFYEEDNWVDDMELGAAMLYQLTGDKKYYQQAHQYSDQEKVTPWIIKDTANHYQFYPFHNSGHFELGVKSESAEKAKLIAYYKEGIEKIWSKARKNAFYRGVPFIWCSNNLTIAFAIQCYQYRKLSGDESYLPLEQACFDWIFGCNPWGTSMVFGLPANGDTPVDPHSSLTVLYNYPLDGGLVDGPVSGWIQKAMLSLKLAKPDEYETFQSMIAVYHDDYGDYSTNEPTMDGTAYLIYLCALKEHEAREVAKGKK